MINQLDDWRETKMQEFQSELNDQKQKSNNNKIQTLYLIMSSVIQELAQKPQQQKNNICFIERLKPIVHQQLKKYTIIYTITNESSTFHYYTVLDTTKSQFIELYWVVEYSSHLLSINVTYTAYRTLGVPIVINDLRNQIQVSFLLKLLNKNAPYFVTFLLNERNEVCINFSRSIFHESDKTYLLRSIKSIVSQTLEIAKQQFQSLISYLTIPIELCTLTFSQQKYPIESEQMNLIKLKNTFDRFRKNRSKTASLIYEETDVLKMRKKIQGYTKILGLELRALENLKFTTKQIQRQKLLEKITCIPQKSQPIKSLITKVDLIAYQFQIIDIVEPQQKTEINANSQIYFGKYSFRIFKTLIENEKGSKSQDFKRKNELKFEEKDVIEERRCCLVKKKAMNKVSQKALRNETSFLKFMRNQICLYIANYFLPVENSWNELYIQKYEQSLLEMINSNKLQSFSTLLSIIIKILEGLKFISDSNVCHRDLKPSNIMISKQNDPKIIDFGSTISVSNKKILMRCNEQLCATEGYYFPYQECNQKIKQMFTKKQYETHPLFDIYSYAVIMEKIFAHEMLQKTDNIVVKDTIVFLVQRCKEQNPDNRLSYDQVMCVLLVLRKIIDIEQKEKISEPL